MTESLFTLMRQEIALIAIIFLLLFIKVSDKKINTPLLFSVLLFANLFSGFISEKTGTLFNEMFVTSSSLILQKNILNIGVFILSLLSFNWIKQHKHAIEFCILLLSSLLGMFYMLSAGNFLMFYLGLELASIPLAALVNFDLEKTTSSEAAVKMILSSAFSSGVLLFGISLLYGTTGTLNFNLFADALNGSYLQVFALLFFIAGVGFKLSIVPFHLWTADVYQGAPVPVTSFLSVISKGAIIFVIMKVFNTAFAPMEDDWVNVFLFLSAVTITLANIFALRQNNIKRLLAFSSVSQAGYILLALASPSELSFTAINYFVLIYIFSNLCAFGTIGIISLFSGKENISDYKGLYSTNPLLAILLALSLFSLAGIPPTAGFFGKYFLLAGAASKGHYLLIIIASLNMIVSLYYYLKVVRAMFFDKSENALSTLTPSKASIAMLIICMIAILLLGFYGNLWNIVSVSNI